LIFTSTRLTGGCLSRQARMEHFQLDAIVGVA
jgi:hypothetical protein